jgi:hypothetical protein
MHLNINESFRLVMQMIAFTEEKAFIGKKQGDKHLYEGVQGGFWVQVKKKERIDGKRSRGAIQRGH